MEGGSYYYRSDNSSSDDGGKTWKEAGFEYFVPGSEDGYAELSVFSVNSYRNCFSYSIKENDILKSRGIYTIINDKLVCVELVKFTYNEYNDLECDRKGKCKADMIEITHLKKSFGDKVLFEDFNLKFLKI